VTATKLLEVEHLTVTLPGREGSVMAVRDVSFALERGRMLGIVGESGSGKTMTALALMGLLPEGARVGGAVRLDGQDLASLPEAELCKRRGNRVAMIFQEPMTALNPLQSVGRQVAEPLVLHRDMAWDVAKAEAARLLDHVRLPDAKGRLGAFPHQLSGGQRQRVMIAMALACRPDLLVADEPTTALDVTVQAQILDLIRDLQKEFGSAVIIITHDLGVVAELADDILVMYGGRCVEYGTAEQVFYEPQHPYTWGLLGSMPRIDRAQSERLIPVKGSPPSLINIPAGCAFNPRCPYADVPKGDVTRTERPELRDLGSGHLSACHMDKADRDRVWNEEIAPKL
jgi:peptide/nickel transport system ATP-binding protein